MCVCVSALLEATAISSLYVHVMVAHTWRYVHIICRIYHSDPSPSGARAAAKVCDSWTTVHGLRLYSFFFILFTQSAGRANHQNSPVINGRLLLVPLHSFFAEVLVICSACLPCCLTWSSEHSLKTRQLPNSFFPLRCETIFDPRLRSWSAPGPPARGSTSLMYRTDFDTHHRIASSKPCSSELHTSIVVFSTHTPHLSLQLNKDYRSSQLQTDKGSAVFFFDRVRIAVPCYCVLPRLTRPFVRKLHQDCSRCQALSC